MRKVKLQNERHGQLDLSAVRDEDGKPVVLQPKGSGKDTRVCAEDVLDHAHVQTFLRQRPPWLSFTRIANQEDLPYRVPSVKEVRDAGYTEPGVAERIVAREQRIADLVAGGMSREDAIRRQAEEARAEAEPPPAAEEPPPAAEEPPPAPPAPAAEEPPAPAAEEPPAPAAEEPPPAPPVADVPAPAAEEPPPTDTAAPAAESTPASGTSSRKRRS